jgi:peptide/nickel transport system substrate-binding protein
MIRTAPRRPDPGGVFRVASSPARDARSNAAKTGGTLTYVYHPEPTALSTIATSAVPVAIISTKIYESLLSYEGRRAYPKPSLAESWTVSDDKKTYTFKLRRDVKWHDGKPFTAEDVASASRRSCVPIASRWPGLLRRPSRHSNARSPHGRLQAQGRGAVLHERVPAGRSADPAQSMPSTASISARPPAVRGAEIMQKPIGTGPFPPQGMAQGQPHHPGKNSDYWDKGRPCLDQVVLRVLPGRRRPRDRGRERRSRSFANERPARSRDPAPVQAAADRDLARGRRGARPEHVAGGATCARHRSPIVKVRQAISMALDRPEIVDVIWYGQGRPAYGRSSAPARSSSTRRSSRTSTASRRQRLLDEAGYKRGTDGVRFKMTQNFLPYGENWSALAEYIRQDLGKGRHLGRDAEPRSRRLAQGGLHRLDLQYHQHVQPQLFGSLDRRRAHLHVRTTSRRARPSPTRWVTRMRASTSCSPRSPRETDPAVRKKQFDEIQQILHDELPVIFLMECPTRTYWNKRVHGLITNGISMYSSWSGSWKE